MYLKSSQRIVDFISLYEKFSPTIYLDAAGKETIGYGHLLLEGEREKFKKGITKEEAKKILKDDLEIAENTIKRLVKVPLNQNQFDALVSFVFNVGMGNFRRSTLLEMLNNGNYNSAANEFLKWIKAGGKVLAGLQRRRADERKIFLS